MFRGTGTAIITPFDDNLNVDYSSLKKFVRFQVENNVDALIVLGTTGEASTIDDDERKKIIEIVLEEVNRKIPVIVGTGTNNTAKVVKLNKIAEDLKADGLLIVNPYYNKGTQNSLIEHYKYISEQTPLSIIIYNVPSRTAMNILPETVVKIHERCSNVIGIKEASGDISQIAKLISMKPKTLQVFSGNDDQTLPIMALGGVGVISVFSNVFPKQMSALTKLLLNNEIEKAQVLNNKLLNFMNLLFIETNPMPVKAAVNILGYCTNSLRLPLMKVTDNSFNILKNEIERLIKNEN